MKLPVILRIFKDDQLTEVKQFDFDQIVIGNQGEVHLQLEDPSVSPIHALIEKRDSGYYVCDLGSTSGTYWVTSESNKKSTQAILDEPLDSGDELKVGPFKISFNVGVPKPKVPPPSIGAKVNSETVLNQIDLHENETKAVEKVSSKDVSENEVSSAKTSEVDETSKSEESTRVKNNIEKTATTNSGVKDKGLAALPKQAPRSVSKESGVNTNAHVKKAAPQNSKLDKNVTVSKPEIKSAVITKTVEPKIKPSSSIKKSHKTFAPQSFTTDVNKVIKPLSRGQCVEVIVCWKERILKSYHFGGRTNILVGKNDPAQIILPGTILRNGFKLGELANGSVSLNILPDMTADLITETGIVSLLELRQNQQIVHTGTSSVYRLNQGEVLRVGIENDTIHFLISYKQAPPSMGWVPLIPLTTSEITSVIISVAVVALLALWVSINTPPEKQEEQKEDQMRLAQFVYNKPKIPSPPLKVEEKPPPPPKPPAPPPPPPPKPVKVEVSDKTQQVEHKGEKNKPIAEPKKASGGAAAPDVAKNNNKNAAKKLTSTVKQGGAIKTSSQNSANANAPKKDVTKIGLFSAFGGGGARAQLDQAYSGAGEVLGVGSQATGTSGQNSDRAGDDVGSKFKDTGAGGKGTATQGISGGFTHGRGSGAQGYGSDGDGIGGRDRVTIQAGGTGEEFVGSIDKEAVRKVVQSKKDAIRRCYEKELNLHPELSGRILMKWVIMEQGRVKWAKVMSSTINNPNVENCLKNELSTWQFPEPPKNLEAEVIFPFLLQSK